MSTHKRIDLICVAAIVLAVAITLLFMNGEALGIVAASRAAGYEARLFDDTKIHTIDIVMDDWDGFIAGCEDEEYVLCSVVIDGEAVKNIGIRAKGNTSLTQVSALDSERYSFKLEFDHYDGSKSYHGLDKLSLNNIIQDNTYMKDFLCYRLMAEFGVNAPLCSYARLSVNGEYQGLYLAVEGVEESFLQRSYGSDYGELYKPDSMSFGGGRGNGRDFNIDALDVQTDIFGDFGGSGGNAAPPSDSSEMPGGSPPSMPESDTSGNNNPSASNVPHFDRQGGMGGSDVKLQYIDDNPDSYSNILDNAKTDVTSADKQRLISSLKSLSAYENLEGVLDIDQVLRYFVVHGFVCNADSYTGSMIHNYYLYEHDGALSMIPWDYNLAFGGFTGGSDATATVNEPIDDVLSDRPMQAWIFSDERYTALYHEYYTQFIADIFDSGRFAELIASTTALISPHVEADPTAFCTYDEFLTGAETLREFCLLRAESVRGQLDGSIPSTSAAQTADSSALIDASSISISDMGTMNAGGFSPPNGQFPGAQGDFDQGGASGDRPQPPDNAQAPGAQGDSDQGGGASGDRPQPPDNTQAPGAHGDSDQGGSVFGDRPQPPDNAQAPGAQGDSDQGGDTSGDRPQPPDNAQAPGAQGDSDQGGGAPDRQNTVGASGKDMIMLAASAAVLAGGILFAVLYKRRRGE